MGVTQRTVAVVDQDAQRAERVSKLLSEQALGSELLTSWEALEARLDALDPAAVVLDLQTLGGAEGATVVDLQLMTAGVPALLLHDDSDDWELELLELQSDFARILSWSASDETISEAIRGLFDIGEGFDSLLPQTLETRIAAPIPSLTSGSLQVTPAPRLLYFLALQQRTGVLTLSRDDLRVTAAFSEGRLLQSDAHSKPEHLQGAFGWTRGDYRFAWSEDAHEGSVIAFLPFIYEGVSRSIPVNDITRRLLEYEERHPVFTTLFVGRHQNLSRLGVVADVGHACTGEHTLAELITRHSDQLETFCYAFAFLLYTDGVTLLDTPSEPPIGLTYRLQDRLQDVSAVTAPEEVLAGEAEVEDGTAFSRADDGTRYQIATLSDEHRALLEQYEDLQRRLIESDPYELFGLVEGCGRDAVHEAFDATTERLPELPEAFPAPLRVTATLVVESLRDTCLLIVANETTDAPADAFGAQAVQQAAAVPYGLDELLQQLTFSIHAAAEADVARSGFQREPTVNRPRDPALAAEAASEGSPERQFELGQRGLKARDYALAREAFEAAHTQAPRNGLYLAYLGWATFLHDPKAARQARIMLKRSLTLEGGREMASFVLGTMALQRGRLDDAEEFFHTVLELRPDSRDALRALKMIELRRAGA